MPSSGKPRGDRGFTLIEVLVALALAILGVGALFEAASGSLGNSGIAAQYVAATRLAQSRLAALGITSAVSPGQQEGEGPQGLRWRVTVTPLAPGRQGDDTTQAVPALYRVQIAVSWRSGSAQRTVTLQSLRLGPVARDDD